MFQGHTSGLTPRGWLGRLGAALGVTCLAAASVLAFTGAPAPADTPAFSSGQASAFAQSFKVNPTASALSIGVTFGQALAPVSAATVSSLMMGFAWGMGGLSVPFVGAFADRYGIERALVGLAFIPLAAAALAMWLPARAPAAAETLRGTIDV